MEPVPETERMEEFRSSHVPTLRISNPKALAALTSSSSSYVSPSFPASVSSPSLSSASPDFAFEPSKKPPTLRRSTDPSPSSPVTSSWSSSAMNHPLPYRPRTASPLSGAHSRSRSTASLTLPMSRTQSLPGVHGTGHVFGSPQLRPISPSGSPSRVRVSRKPADEAFPPQSPVRSSVLEPDRRQRDRSISPAGQGVSTINNGRIRRTSSPYRNIPYSSSGSFNAAPSTPSSVSSSPSYRSYDGSSSLYLGSLSSVPSTPTSARSRSPSISSLETIPDTPDAEEAALEAEKTAQLKPAAEAVEGGDAKGRASLDVPTRGRTLAFGSRDKRKRWSVCGAERRGDLDLETIWED